MSRATALKAAESRFVGTSKEPGFTIVQPDEWESHVLAEPNCFTRECKHLIGVDQPDGTEGTERVICAAFPKGIPDEIAYGPNLHTKPYAGDKGIQFEKEK